MKIPFLILAAATLFTGCYSRREVVYDEPVRTTVVHERAGAPVRVYGEPVRVYTPTRVYAPSRVYGPTRVYVPSGHMGGDYPYPRRGVDPNIAGD